MKLSNSETALGRALDMLKVSAEYLRTSNDTSMTIHYDEADCDGDCLAEDCKIAAEALSEYMKKRGLK